jgi:hypothetical protein
MRKLILAAIVFVPFLAAGCQHSHDSGGAPGGASSATPEARPVAPGGAPPGTAPGAGVVASGQPAEAPPAPRWREVEVPAGTELEIRLDDTVSSATNRPEDAVSATLVERVAVGGVTAIPAGSTVSGSVTSTKRPGKVKGVAELAIRFDSVKAEAGGAYRVRTGIVTRRGASEKKKDALKIGAPAAGGAILGGILGGKKGALIGTTVGGGAGTAVVLSTRGKDVRLPKGSRMVIKLMDPVTVRVPA